MKYDLSDPGQYAAFQMLMHRWANDHRTIEVDTSHVNVNISESIKAVESANQVISFKIEQYHDTVQSNEYSQDLQEDEPL